MSGEVIKSWLKKRAAASRWWQEAEDPFQALAAALDIRAAIVSGDPANYVSHCPVMMDGSCNGLQHYAALGLDQEGGSSVNMVRVNKPQVSCPITNGVWVQRDAPAMC